MKEIDKRIIESRLGDIKVLLNQINMKIDIIRKNINEIEEKS